MDFKESKTYKNLEKAFEGESKAHLKYQFYKSKIANTSKELENLLDEIIHNEKEHGKIWFKLLHNKKVPDTIENLIDGISGEHYESSEMYINFYKTALEEGYDDIANLFLQVAEIEKSHCKRYEVLLNNVRKNTVFHKDDKISWICGNCGHVHIGSNAPNSCPVCDHPQSYFREQLFNYL